MTLNLGKLNPRQREAVLHENGPLLVLAGAGSGKTSTMAYRIAHLVAARHLPSSAILGLSFTNKAAHELKERVVKLVSSAAGHKAAKGLTITTFHSLCVRILRAYADKLGFQKDFTIVDQNDQKDILRQVLKNIKIDERKFDPDVILFEIGQAKNRFMSREQAETHFLEGRKLSQDYALAAASSFGKYQDQLRVLNAMDFDDLLYYGVKLLQEHEDVREFYNVRFRHILVDEYQDTNPSQFKLLRLLTERYQNICVVGDDDQSIYAWRGADPAHILEFGRHYPGARAITLDQNYRSTSSILDAANHVISQNKHRHPKTLWSERGTGEPLTEVVLEQDRDEASWVGDEILGRAKALDGQGRPWKDFAILYRSNAQSRLFEEALRMRQIPYKIVGGMSFLDRKEIKDLLCYWRLVVNPKDDGSLRRVLNWPARGIGKTSVENLGTHAFQSSICLFEALSEAPRLAPRSVVGAKAFQDLIHELRRRLENAPATPAGIAQWGKESLELIQVKKAIEEEVEDPVQVARKWESVDELVNSLGQIRPEEIAAESHENLPLPPEKAPAPSITAKIEDFDFAEIPTSFSDRFADHAAEAAHVAQSSALADVAGAIQKSTATAASATIPAPSPANALATGEVPGVNGVTLLREFLAKMALDAAAAEENKNDKDKDKAQDKVTLLTLHGAKGLEYPIVFLVGMEEGFLPHKRTIEEGIDFSEERRLCYVGITRARDHLILTRTRNRIRYGKPVPRTPSRFLEEIPKELIVQRNESSTPDLSTKQAVEEHEVKVKSFLEQIRARISTPQ